MKRVLDGRFMALCETAVAKLFGKREVHVRFMLAAALVAATTENTFA